MKKTIIQIIVLVLLVGLLYFLFKADQKKQVSPIQEPLSEESAAVEHTEAEVEITGTWVSTQDIKSTIIYKEDGTFEDIYDGETLNSGTWEIYTNDSAEYNPSGRFLRTTANEESLEYAIISIENNVLQLNYLARGNTLEYKLSE